MTERWAFVFREGSRLNDREPIFGEQRAVVELARYVQRARRADVSLLVDADSESAFGVPVGCGARLTEQVRWIRQHTPELVVGISTGLIFCHARGQKNIVYHHNPTIVEGVGEFGRELYSRIQKLIVVSRAARNQQLEWGAPRGKLAVVNNGVDHSIFSPKGDGHRPEMLVFAGTIIDYKGLDVVLAAFEEANQRCHDLELHVYGKNVKYEAAALAREGAEWMNEQGLLDSSGVADWGLIEKKFPGVRYQGCAEAERLAAAFSEAGLLLVGSRIAETFGITSIEAQACGCIPIVPDHGGLPETILPGMTGITYPAGDASRLAEQIIRFCDADTSGKLKDWRRRAVEHVQRHYSWEKTGESFCREVDAARPHRLGNALAARFWKLRRKTRQRFRRKPNSKRT